MDTLRVLTLNVWNRSGPWETRKGLIRAALEELRPDVIGLQEIVGDTEAETQAHELMRGLSVDGAPWHIAFHEWRAIWTDVRNSRSLREAFLYTFGPPGWSPDGSRKTSAQQRHEAGFA